MSETKKEKEYERRLLFEINRRNKNFTRVEETKEELEDILAKLVEKEVIPLQVPAKAGQVAKKLTKKKV